MIEGASSKFGNVADAPICRNKLNDFVSRLINYYLVTLILSSSIVHVLAGNAMFAERVSGTDERLDSVLPSKHAPINVYRVML